jgi:hypothetical protein
MYILNLGHYRYLPLYYSGKVRYGVTKLENSKSYHMYVYSLPFVTCRIYLPRENFLSVMCCLKKTSFNQSVGDG